MKAINLIVVLLCIACSVTAQEQKVVTEKHYSKVISYKTDTVKNFRGGVISYRTTFRVNDDSSCGNYILQVLSSITLNRIISIDLYRERCKDEINIYSTNLNYPYNEFCETYVLGENDGFYYSIAGNRSIVIKDVGNNHFILSKFSIYNRLTINEEVYVYTSKKKKKSHKSPK